MLGVYVDESASRKTVSFDFFAVHESRNNLISEGTTFLLHPVFFLFFFTCFEIVQSSHPYIRMGSKSHSSALILVSIKMYLYLFFACATFYANSVLLCPSLDIKDPKYLNESICWSLFPLIKILIYGHSLFRLTTITSDFLLFNSNPFLLLSSSTMSNYCCKSSLFSAIIINTVSSAYLVL